MVSFRIMISLALSSAIFSTAYAESQHTGYWKQNTPTGNSFKCREVTNQEQMQMVLQKSGWDMNRGTPRIDWKRDEATIVAPSKYYEDADIAFYGLEREDGVAVLKYGWKQRRTTIEEDDNEEDEDKDKGVRSFSSSSMLPGEPETIIVSYRKGLDDGLKFVCRNIGKVR